MAVRSKGKRGPVHGFPSMRPDITIKKCGVKLDPIECLELQWWFAIPRLNDHTTFAKYEVETLELDGLTDIVTVEPLCERNASHAKIQP